MSYRKEVTPYHSFLWHIFTGTIAVVIDCRYDCGNLLGRNRALRECANIGYYKTFDKLRDFAFNLTVKDISNCKTYLLA